jgi:hypothetical protein
MPLAVEWCAIVLLARMEYIMGLFVTAWALADLIEIIIWANKRAVWILSSNVDQIIPKDEFVDLKAKFFG